MTVYRIINPEEEQVDWRNDIEVTSWGATHRALDGFWNLSKKESDRYAEALTQRGYEELDRVPLAVLIVAGYEAKGLLDVI